jgi:hypothetical protein
LQWGLDRLLGDLPVGQLQYLNLAVVISRCAIAHHSSSQEARLQVRNLRTGNDGGRPAVGKATACPPSIVVHVVKMVGTALSRLCPPYGSRLDCRHFAARRDQVTQRPG